MAWSGQAVAAVARRRLSEGLGLMRTYFDYGGVITDVLVHVGGTGFDRSTYRVGGGEAFNIVCANSAGAFVRHESVVARGFR